MLVYFNELSFPFQVSESLDILQKKCCGKRQAYYYSDNLWKNKDTLCINANKWKRPFALYVRKYYLCLSLKMLLILRIRAPAKKGAS